MSLKCNLTAGSPPAQQGVGVNLVPPTAPGVGAVAGSVDRCYAGTYSVTSGTPVTINLLTALDPCGTAAGIVYIEDILIENDNTTAGQDLTVGGGTHPALGTDSYTVQAGTSASNVGAAQLHFPTGLHIVTSSSDTLTLTAASGTITGKIVVLGRSA